MTWRKEENYRKREEKKVRRKKIKQVCMEGMKWMEERNEMKEVVEQWR